MKFKREAQQRGWEGSVKGRTVEEKGRQGRGRIGLVWEEEGSMNSLKH